MSEPVRAVKASEDLDEQFDGIVDALRRDVRTLRQQVERYGRTYQKHAEDRSRQTTHGELDEETQRGYRRLKQLQLVIQHIESSAAYLLGSGIDPSSDSDDEAVEVAQRVLGSLEAERERLYRDVHDGPAQVLANAIFEVEYLERITERAPAERRQTLKPELAGAAGMAWSRANDSGVLHVTDDGRGFDLVKAARHKKSVGLLSMRERAELIGGSLQIQSTPGKGTAVTLLLPVEKKVEPLRARRTERTHKEQE